mmetsp:Transcript_16987/g.19441  ORF Transcript_16987/g.19441 Transcript_16987/m.19441 type:complete len:296 (+) Transcript_16987:357-1244(+)
MASATRGLFSGISSINCTSCARVIINSRYRCSIRPYNKHLENQNNGILIHNVHTDQKRDVRTHTAGFTTLHVLLPRKIKLQHYEQNQIFAASSSFSSKSSSSCPFRILSIPKDSLYSTAKKTFLKIAMQNHPDTIHQNLSKSDPQYEAKLKKGENTFRIAREAFETLVEGDDGFCRLRIEVEAEAELEEMNDEQFDAWFLHETGHSNPYNFNLDPQTMREVAEAAETMGGGAERDGGMWGLARMVGNAVKDGKSGANVLSLEAGVIRDGEDVEDRGRLRRRRQMGGTMRNTGRRR